MLSDMAHTISQLMQLTQGERLVRARKVAGMKQEHIATALGKDVRTIGRWEREEVVIQRAELIAWAVITEVPLEWLESGAVTEPVTLGSFLTEYEYRTESLFSDAEFATAA